MADLNPPSYLSAENQQIWLRLEKDRENLAAAAQSNIWEGDIANTVGYISAVTAEIINALWTENTSRGMYHLLNLFRKYVEGENTRLLCQDITTRAEEQIQIEHTIQKDIPDSESPYYQLLSDNRMHENVIKADFVIAVLNNLSIAAAKRFQEIAERFPDQIQRLQEQGYRCDTLDFFFSYAKEDELSLDVYVLAIHEVITKFLEYLHPTTPAAISLYADGKVYKGKGDFLRDLSETPEGKRKVALASQLIRDTIVATLAEPNSHYRYSKNGKTVHPTHEDVLLKRIPQEGKKHSRRKTSQTQLPQLQGIIHDQLHLADIA